MKKHTPPATMRRTRSVRLDGDAARKVQDGHPWVFRDALRGRQPNVAPGEAVEVLDSDGSVIGNGLYEEEGAIALRLYSWMGGVGYDNSHIKTAVAHAAARRTYGSEHGPISCQRVLSGDSEGVPAVNVDRYGDFLVMSAFSAITERTQDTLVAALASQWRPKAIYRQCRYQPPGADRPRNAAQLVYGEPAPAEVIVEEGGVRYAIDVTAPVGTGLFIDMRLGRRAVAQLAPGRRVLNCFSYTGAFSVVAAKHGAAEIVSVDSAARAHARAQRNMALNGLNVEDKDRFQFISSDAMATMTRFADRKRMFDLVVLDPPTFASGKGKRFSAVSDYRELVEAAVRVLAPGGILCAACNAAKISWAEFGRSISAGVLNAGTRPLVHQRLGQPEDFPVLAAFEEGQYLKIIVASVTSSQR